MNYEQKYKDILVKRKQAQKKYLDKLKSENATEQQKEQRQKILQSSRTNASNYYLNNKEKIKQKSKERYQANKEKILERQKIYYQKKKEQKEQEEENNNNNN